MAGEMAQRKNVFSVKTDDLTSVPEPHSVEGKNQFQVIFSVPWRLSLCPPTSKMKKKERSWNHTMGEISL